MTVEAFIKADTQKANINTDDSFTPLQWVYGEGKKIEVREAGAESTTDDSFTPLQWVYGEGKKIEV
jgi:hypothetical protein